MEFNETMKINLEFDKEKEVRDCLLYTSCPVCGAFELEHYYINDDEECVGCSECVRKSDVMY